MVESKRRLLAIMSADVAGYSRLMGADEAATVDALNACRAVFKARIAEHDGRVVDTAGDSVLATFASVVEAVRCAVAVQGDLAARDADAAEDRRMRFRIGVNLGDIIEQDDGTIYGDGVNIAARLESLAKPGGVTISDDAYRQVRNKLDFTFADLGEHDVKNIAEPVRAHEVVLADAAPAAAPMLAAKPKGGRPSLAVLPFDNMSGDAEQEYFCDGIVEDLITAMSKFPEITVIARNTTFTYKGKAVDVTQVGRDLGVGYVVEGSVRRAGNRARITAQLVDAETGDHLWADRFDRDLNDIFAVQDEISASIAATLGHTLRSAGMTRARRMTDAELDVWDVIARGMWHAVRYTKDDNATAQAIFRRALDREPENANAMAQLALAICVGTLMGWQAGAAMGDAVALARASMAAEPDNATAHASAGLCFFMMRDRVEAERLFAMALQLNPNDAFSHFALGGSLASAGERDAAFDCFARAERLSPRDPIFGSLMPNMKGVAEILAGNVAAALGWAEQSLRTNPMRAMALRQYVVACVEAGETDKAEDAVAELARIDPDMTFESWSARVPMYKEADRARYIEAFKKAGMKG